MTRLYPTIIALVGPTASGKTELAQCVAEHLDAEILSCDSMQIYRGMDIGTGKLLPHERRVVHHGFDIVEPGQPFSAALYQEYARDVIDSLAKQHKPCVVCGGTGFYIRAALDDFSFPKGEQENNPVREKYQAFLQNNGPEALWNALNEKDPKSAAIIPPNDTKRVIRSFELLDEGLSYADQHEQFSHIEPYYDALYFGLSVETEVLRKRIDRRVDSMIEQGLVEEVEGLLQKGLREGITAPYAIGYKEMVSYLDGHCSLQEAVERIKIATHRYAKRQRTWFRKDQRIVWLEATQYQPERLTSEILERINEGGLTR